DVPEPVKSAAPPGWVYRSDEPSRVLPSRPSVAPQPIEPAIATSALAGEMQSTALGPPARAAGEPHTTFDLFNPVTVLPVGFRMMAVSVMTPFLVGAALMSRLNRR